MSRNKQTTQELEKKLKEQTKSNIGNIVDVLERARAFPIITPRPSDNQIGVWGTEFQQTTEENKEVLF